jgi:hypothetical protein
MSDTQCAVGVCCPERTQGLVAPAGKKKHTLVSLKGPGLFLGASISKQGGDTGLTFISLDIDGRNVFSLSFSGMRNWGLTAQNPSGMVLLTGHGVDTMTLGFPVPLSYAKSLVLSAQVSENNVVQIVANVFHGGC